MTQEILARAKEHWKSIVINRDRTEDRLDEMSFPINQRWKVCKIMAVERSLNRIVKGLKYYEGKFLS